MPQFNVNGPGSPAFILTSEKIEQAQGYKSGKQEDVSALQNEIKNKANTSDLENYTDTDTLNGLLAKKANSDDLKDYATNAALTSGLELKANSADVEKNYATKEELNQAKVGTTTTLEDYAKKDYVQEQLAPKADAKTVEDTYAKKSEVASAVRYKESVQTLTELQERKTTAQLGDLFNVVESDMNYVYNGSDFDALAPMVDLSGYALKTYVDGEVAKKANTVHNHQASEVTFEDGEDFQTKLDNGSLKGPKGDKGEAGAAGKDGAAGAKGDAGPNLVDATTSTSLNGILKGNGTTVALATDGTDYMSPSKVSAAVNEVTKKYYTGTLTQTGWKSNTQSITLAAVSADTTAQYITVRPVSASFEAYCEAGIYCSAQSAGSLAFKCQNTPSANISIEIAIEKMMKG